LCHFFPAYKKYYIHEHVGKPEPTSLPPPRSAPSSANYNKDMMTSISSNGGGGFGSSSTSSGGGGGTKPGGQDPNGMERLVGESDEQYIARQTRLRDEAKARMAAKFGGSGGGGGMMMMGGVGSNNGGGGGGGRMGGIGSDPNYNPNGGGYHGASDFDVSALSSTVMSGLGSAFGALSTVANTVTAAVADESTKRSVVETAGSFWGGLSKGASTLINTVTQPDGFDAGSDGLEDLQRQFHSQRSTQPSKYGGFGSDSMFAGGSRPTTTNMMGGSSSSTMATAGPSFASNMQSTLGEALPGPGEDPNGIERLSGESDEQYVMRQTRLRDEAKARMAAKFGGGAGRMGGVGSSGGGGGGGMGSSSSSSGGGSAPSSGGFGGMKPTPPPPKLKVASGEDFFANFGT
jgi:hypothetical protein